VLLVHVSVHVDIQDLDKNMATSFLLPLPTQTHHPVTYSRAGTGTQAMTAPSLVESRRPEAKAIIDMSDENGTISCDTEGIPTPKLSKIVAGIVSRN
jgi:hypothetical protein